MPWLSLATVAVSVDPWPTCTDTVVGDTLTAMAGLVGAGAGVEFDLEATPEQPYDRIPVTKMRP